ncbi:LOW QUALITY PROTEIN: ufm1-specific protease 1 [Emydura macquarii macquarii]|uniref:LOW QUALITY PROTEIN: ufm1-specific protease 1 n=1 Tax=Emydura macquarii macquarii TaxID=1129001 RepID=UPI00352B0F53
MEGAGDPPTSLLLNIHQGLPFPGSPTRAALVSGPYLYYHYGCDGLDDRGWGCGYRTLQTLCSWLVAGAEPGGTPSRPVPPLPTLQQALVEMGDKAPAFAGSQDWIGTVEAALCIDWFFGVPCKILHSPRGRGLEGQLGALYAHFQGGGGPVMLGGDADSSSKGILGVCSAPPSHHLLILDPHYYGAGSLGREGAQAAGWVGWRALASFDTASFYNLCLPQFFRQSKGEGAGEN